MYFTLQINKINKINKFNKICIYISKSNINMSKYTDFVDEYKKDDKFSDNKNDYSYSIVNTTYLQPNFNSLYNFKKDDYYTEEPTETQSMQTNSPIFLPYNTKCPSITNSTFMPTIKMANNSNSNSNNNSNNNNNLIIALTIPFSALFLSLVLIIIYYYKCYLIYKKKQRQREMEKKNEFDLSFGLSYVDDF